MFLSTRAKQRPCSIVLCSWMARDMHLKWCNYWKTSGKSSTFQVKGTASFFSLLKTNWATVSMWCLSLQAREPQMPGSWAAVCVCACMCERERVLNGRYIHRKCWFLHACPLWACLWKFSHTYIRKGCRLVSFSLQLRSGMPQELFAVVFNNLSRYVYPQRAL